MTSTSVFLSQGPLSNENSLLRCVFDRNQNASCQLSVVKRCFSIVDLIKFSMNLAVYMLKVWSGDLVAKEIELETNFNVFPIGIPSLF